MNAPWSPQQREWLQALGHDVLMPAGAAGWPESSTAQDVPPEPVATSARLRAAAASPGPAGMAPASQATASPLLRALLRAAGCGEIGELPAGLPDPARLRGDAAAKRALWPRLRTLRKPPRGR